MAAPQHRADRVLSNPHLKNRWIMMTPFLTLRRLTRLAAFQVGVAGFCVANAYLAADEEYESLVAHSHNVKTKEEVGILESLKQSGATGQAALARRKVLDPVEEKCVAAVTSLLSFDLRPFVMKSFHHCIELDDPFMALRGLPEFRDAWKFLGVWFSKSNPRVVEILRPAPGFSVASPTRNHLKNKLADSELIVKYENDATLQVGPLSYSYNFRSSARVLIADEKIVKMEHRWWHGPLKSSSLSQSVSISSPASHGDPQQSTTGGTYAASVPGSTPDGLRTLSSLATSFFEADRRLNGFIVSLFLSGSNSAANTVGTGVTTK